MVSSQVSEYRRVKSEVKAKTLVRQRLEGVYNAHVGEGLLNRDEPRDERSYAGRHVEPVADVYDDAISLQPLLKTLWSYRQVVSFAVAGVMGIFAVAMLAAYVFLPVERLGTLEFRLLFDGASQGQYPNETPFSSAEITSTPVLTEVFEANDLESYGSYEDFKNSVFVLQSNPELEFLSYEYEAKLAASGLSPVDRASIEEEFQTRRDGLTDPLFSLNLREDARLSPISPSVVSKVLDDTLATWARQADERKGALRYNIPVFSKNILRWDLIEREDYITGIDILRAQLRRIIANIDEIAILPGAAVIRIDDGHTSLAEIRVNLEDVLRFQIQPLVGMIRMTGLSRDPQSLARYVDDQLFQISLERAEAEKRVAAVQESLRAYMLQRGAVPQAGSGGAIPRPAPGGEAMMPQLGESFLDRLLEMSTMNSDIGYRQRLTDRIILESVAVAALEREQTYYEDLSRSVVSLEPRSRDADRESELVSVKARFEGAFDQVVVAVDQVNAIYEELSTHNLNPTTLLYTVTAPFTMRTERALSLRTAVSYGALVFMLSLFLVPLGCLAHGYFQREVVHRETEERPAQRAPARSEGQREEEPAERTVGV